MSDYTPVYTKPYEEGFVNAPPYETPVTAEVLNGYDSAIKNIETYLEENPIEAGGGGDNIDLTTGTADAKFRNLSAANSISLNRKAGTQTGSWSVAVGGDVTASATYSHAEGNRTVASGDNSHTEGSDTEASGSNSHAEGSNTKASGEDSHAEGFGTKATFLYAHAEGFNTTASAPCAHAEGNNTTASAPCAHAEGSGTVARQSAHAEGEGTTAEGASSHAEGYHTTTSSSATYSHAEGIGTTAGAPASHAEGIGTEAGSDYQHVQGMYNIVDRGKKYANIVGNGKSDKTRSNASTLDWEGNAWFAGTTECKGIILTDTADSTKRFLLQITDGQLSISEVTTE